MDGWRFSNWYTGLRTGPLEILRCNWKEVVGECLLGDYRLCRLHGEDGVDDDDEEEEDNDGDGDERGKGKETTETEEEEVDEYNEDKEPVAPKSITLVRIYV